MTSFAETMAPNFVPTSTSPIDADLVFGVYPWVDIGASVRALKGGARSIVAEATSMHGRGRGYRNIVLCDEVRGPQPAMADHLCNNNAKTRTHDSQRVLRKRNSNLIGVEAIWSASAVRYLGGPVHQVAATPGC